ncbi:MAG: ParM/StbA family protein [Shewanella sp.]|uniref:ParM/StbA family protein n=1 Tax=Shewanella sp. TaxID=50422 RepID=UPI003F2C8B1F
MFVLGVDIGYSNLKLAFGQSGSAPKTIILPAGAGPADHMAERIGGGDDETCLYVSVDNERWAAGICAGRLQSWERELHPEYPSTKTYKALFHAALLMAETESIDLIVTGLPVTQFNEPQRKSDLVNRLKGIHQVTPKRTITVHDVKVLPQPAGAYMDLVQTGDDLGLIEEGRVVVIDPGFFSVDWVALDAGEIRYSSSGTSLQAMSVILETIDKLISEDHGAKVGMDRLERAMRTGLFDVLLFGEKVKILPYLNVALKKVAPVALTAMRQSMRNESINADLVLIAGGGATAYKEAAKEIFSRSKIIVPEQSVLANARGFWFYGA